MQCTLWCISWWDCDNPVLEAVEERVKERGRRRLSGCNNPPEKQPVENDERPANMPQEHEEKFQIKCEYRFISEKLVSKHLGRQVNIE